MKARLTKPIEYQRGAYFPAGTEVTIANRMQLISVVVYPNGIQGYVKNCDLEPLEKEQGPTTPGEVVMEAVIRGSAIQKVLPRQDGGLIFVWAANAVDQIEAALEELGWEVRRKE